MIRIPSLKKDNACGLSNHCVNFYKSYAQRWIMCLLFATLTANQIRADIDDNLKAKIMKDGGEILEKYKDTLNSYIEESELLGGLANEPTRKRRVTIKAAVKDDWFYFERKSYETDQVTELNTNISCANNKYNFLIVKKDQLSAFSLVKYSKDKPLILGGPYSHQAFEDLDLLLKAISGNGNYTLSVLKSEKNSPQCEGELVKKNNAPGDILTRRFKLNPSRSWRIEKQETKTKNSQSTDTFFYPDKSDFNVEFPVKLHHLTHFTDPNTGKDKDIEANITLKISKNNLPNTTYFLPAYGLPEPPEPPKR